MRGMTPEPWPPDMDSPVVITPLNPSDSDADAAATYQLHAENIATIIASMPKRGLFLRCPLSVSRAQIALYLEAVGHAPGR